MFRRLLVVPLASTSLGREEIVSTAVRRGFTRFLLPPGDAAPRGAGLELYRDLGERWEREPHVPGSDVSVRSIHGPAELDQLLKAEPEVPRLAIRWAGDRVIPLENVVARWRGKVEVWVVARRPEEASAALGALEHGADHVAVEVRGPEEVDRLVELSEVPRVESLSWQAAPITRVEPVGMGDRVIVDTTSILRPNEGLLVGSSAGFLFHVASEAVGSRFTRPRPFRVNAGSAHSYVLMSDGSTRYLSELSAGDAVLVAAPLGSVRLVRVGRLKVERRPLLMVEVERGAAKPTVFLQEAETVRLSMGPDERTAATDLRPGVRVFGVSLPPARHMGEAVQESIEER